MSKTASKGRNGGKQKAWRLGSMLLPKGLNVRVDKATRTALGAALRDNPGLLRHVNRAIGVQRLGVPRSYAVLPGEAVFA